MVLLFMKTWNVLWIVHNMNLATSLKSVNSFFISLLKILRRVPCVWICFHLEPCDSNDIRNIVNIRDKRIWILTSYSWKIQTNHLGVRNSCNFEGDVCVGDFICHGWDKNSHLWSSFWRRDILYRYNGVWKPFGSSHVSCLQRYR